jgi:(p)ppGpp synthase/HD superfamily hydrolase
MNLFKRMIEAITDFDSEEQPIYDWAKQKHDATNKTRKHSGDPYWVHPEGVAKIAK